MDFSETERVRRIAEELTHGDSAAAAQLLSVVYDELRTIAAGVLSKQVGEHSLQPTALVHELYVRLAGRGQPDPPANAANDRESVAPPTAMNRGLSLVTPCQSTGLIPPAAGKPGEPGWRSTDTSREIS